MNGGQEKRVKLTIGGGLRGPGAGRGRDGYSRFFGPQIVKVPSRKKEQGGEC